MPPRCEMSLWSTPASCPTMSPPLPLSIIHSMTSMTSRMTWQPFNCSRAHSQVNCSSKPRTIRNPTCAFFKSGWSSSPWCKQTLSPNMRNSNILSIVTPPFCTPARTFQIWHRQHMKAVMTWIQMLTMVILESFLLMEGSQFYCQELLALHPKVHLMIITNHYKHHDEQQDAMIIASVSFDDLCCLAEDLYHTDLQKGRWCLAVHNKDSKLPPHVFANLSQTQAFTLQQQSLSTKNRHQDSNHNGGNRGQNHNDSNSMPSGGCGGLGGNGHSESCNSNSNGGPTKPSWHHISPPPPPPIPTKPLV